MLKMLLPSVKRIDQNVDRMQDSKTRTQKKKARLGKSPKYRLR